MEKKHQKIRLKNLVYLALILNTLTARNEKSDFKPLMVIEIARHGARAPTKPNKLGIPWIGESLDYGYGSLIPSGYRQHFISGIEKTMSYREILSQPLNDDEYSVVSSGKERTLESAFGHFLGFSSTVFDKERTLKVDVKSDFVLPPQKLNFDVESFIEKFVKDSRTSLPFGFNPPIVHSKNLLDETLIRFHGYKECKDYFDTTAAIQEVRYPEFGNLKKVKKLRKNLRKFLLKKFGKKYFKKSKKIKKALKKLDFRLMAKLADLGLAQKRLVGEKSQEFLFKENPKILEKLRFVNNLKQVSLFKDRGFCRIITSEFLIHLSALFFKKAKFRDKLSYKDKHIKNMKYIFYSTHDTFITPLLINLGLVSPECVEEELEDLKHKGCHSKPEVSSNVVFELLENHSKEYVVRSLYKGEFFDFCLLKDKLNSEDIDEFYSCTLNIFNKRIAELTISNWKETCIEFNKKKEAEEKILKGDNSRIIFGVLCKVGFFYGLLTILVIYSCFFMSYFVFKLGMLEDQLLKVYEKVKEENPKEESLSDDGDIFEEKKLKKD